MGAISTRTALMEILSLNPFFHRTIIRPMETCSVSDVTPTQMRTIFALAIHDRLPMGTLAADLDISKQQLTKVIDVLVEKGYVERVDDKTNRRLVLVQLSAHGSVLANQVLNEIADELTPEFDSFTDKEKENLYNAALTIKQLMERVVYE